MPGRKMQTLSDLKRSIRKASQILLITHLNPDGDAVGSMLALSVALQKMQKRTVCVCDGKIMEKYAFLKSAGEILKPDRIDAVFDLAIAIDCADQKRMGSAEKLFFAAKENANIDHHGTNESFGRINIVHSVSSSGELIYELIEELGTGLDAETAECLYTAISTDTGNFTYSNTTKKALLYTAELIGLFDYTRTADYLYRTRTYENTRLIAKAIDNLSLYEEGRAALMYLCRSDLAEADVKNPDYEMIVNYASEIDTVKVAVFLRELKDGGYKLSLRSSGDLDVAALCAEYGGGGHKNAAGCSMNAPFEEVKETILSAVKKLLNA